MDSLSDLIRCDYSVLQNVILDILARLKNQEQKVASLESTVREKDSVINQLRDEMSVINNFNSKYGNIGDRLTLIEQAVSQQGSQLAHNNESIMSILQRLDKLDFGGNFGQSSSDIKSRLESLEGNNDRIDKLERNVNHLEEFKADKTDLETQLCDIENNIKNLQQQLSRQGNMVRDQMSAISKFDGMLDEDGNMSSGGGKRGAVDMSNYVEKSLYDSDIAALQETDNGHSIEIRKLWSAIKKLRNEQEEMVDANNVRDSQISELRTAIGALGKLVNSLTDTVNNLADKRDLMLLRDDLLKQLKDTSALLREHMKNELKRFEGDLMQYLDERDNDKDSTETAIGKVYFRCQTCNQPTQTQHGPHSKHYQYTQGNAIGASGVAVRPTTAGMIIEKGNDVTVHGSDGGVYKGREESNVHFMPTTTLAITDEQPKTARGTAQFKVTYNEKDRSAPGSRGSQGTSRGIGGANGGASLNRPQSARLPIKYDATHPKHAQLNEFIDTNKGQPLALEDNSRAKTAHSTLRPRQ